MSDPFDKNNGYGGENRNPEEPERVEISHFYGSGYRTPPPQPPRSGNGHDSTALIFGILSVVLSSCFPPLAILFSVLSFVWIKKYYAMGGNKKSGASVAAILLSVIGILFSILTVALVVLSVLNGDLNSIYGLFAKDYSEFASDPTKA